MKKVSTKIVPNDTPLTEDEFMESFNKNMPQGYPRVTRRILQKFKEQHESLFKKKDVYTLDSHRKRLIDWLPQNLK